MPNTFGAKQDCVVDFFVSFRVTFSGVEVYLKPFSHLSLGCKDLLQEGIDRCVVVLFVHHVKSNDKLVA